MKRFTLTLTALLTAGLLTMAGAQTSPKKKAPAKKKPATAKTSTAKTAPAAKKPAATASKTAKKTGEKKIEYFNGTDTEFRKEIRKGELPGLLLLVHEKSTASKAFVSNVLGDTNVINLLDTGFAVMKMDMNADIDPANNPVFKYNVEDVPSVILFDRNGMPVGHKDGTLSKEDFVAFIRSAYE